jgi:hypothetical protein
MLLVSTQTNQPRSKNIGQTQMASLSQPAQNRLPGGPPANWQTISAQNERTFANAQSSMTTQQASLARPAVTPIDTTAAPPAPSPAESSSVSRPYSEGWYAKRRDQAQAALQTGTQSSLRIEGQETPPSTADLHPVADSTPTGPTTPKRIEATPAKAALPPAPPAASKNDPRVLLEWTRSADEPYRPSAELTGVALRDRETVLR